MLVVGHQPFLGKLVACLVLGVEEPGIVLFAPGTVVCVERAADGRWAVVWIVRPELLG